MTIIFHLSSRRFSKDRPLLRNQQFQFRYTQVSFRYRISQGDQGSPLEATTSIRHSDAIFFCQEGTPSGTDPIHPLYWMPVAALATGACWGDRSVWRRQYVPIELKKGTAEGVELTVFFVEICPPAGFPNMVPNMFPAAVKDPLQEYRTAEEQCAQTWEADAIGLLPGLPPRMQRLIPDRMHGSRFDERSYIIQQVFKLPDDYPYRLG